MAAPIPAYLPLDARGLPIQTLAPSGDRITLAITGSSLQSAVPTSALTKGTGQNVAPGKPLRISATVDCYINFGTSAAVVAAADNTSILFPAGVEVVRLPYTATNVAVIEATATGGTLQVEVLN
jgi:hypothetical protein